MSSCEKRPSCRRVSETKRERQSERERERRKQRSTPHMNAMAIVNNGHFREAAIFDENVHNSRASIQSVLQKLFDRIGRSMDDLVSRKERQCRLYHALWIRSGRSRFPMSTSPAAIRLMTDWGKTLMVGASVSVIRNQRIAVHNDRMKREQRDACARTGPEDRSRARRNGWSQSGVGIIDFFSSRLITP